MVRLVWLLGASGVGKSTTGYELARTLSAGGTRTAFVDADQLRNAANIAATEDDLVASGLAALVPAYRSAGARVLVVAGLAHDREHLARLLPLARDEVLVCHLKAEPATLRERISGRGWLLELTESAVQYADQLDPGIADLTIDTTGTSIDEVCRSLVGQVMQFATRACESEEPPEALEGRGLDGVRTVLLTGPGGVGSSTVGFLTFLQLSGQGARVAYLDSHQLGFVGDSPRSGALAALRATSSALVAANIASRGADVVVLSSDLETAGPLQQALADRGSRPTVFGLRATAETLADRLQQRSRGGGPPLAGDHRLRVEGADLDRAIAQSVAELATLDGLPDGAHTLRTDGRGPSELAQEIAATVS